MTDKQSAKRYDTCGAKKRQGEGYCTRPAGWGTDHAGFGTCKLHLGSTPIQSVKAKTEMVMREAREAVRKFDIVPVQDPLTELQRIAGELIAVKNWLRGHVERLETIRYEGRAGEQVRAELVVYQASLRDATSALATIVKLGIDERLSRIQESAVASIVEAVDRGVRESGITGSQAVQVKAAIAGHLRMVAA